MPGTPRSHRSDLPGYQDLIYPTLKAVAALGGSAQARDIMAWVLDDLRASHADVAISYDNDPRSVLINRLEWARSYAKLGGALDRPRRATYVLTAFGREILAEPEIAGVETVREMERRVRASKGSRSQSRDQLP